MHLSTYLAPIAYLVPVAPVTGDNKFVKRAYPYVYYSLSVIFLYEFH